MSDCIVVNIDILLAAIENPEVDAKELGLGMMPLDRLDLYLKGFKQGCNYSAELLRKNMGRRLSDDDEIVSRKLLNGMRGT